MTNNQQASFKLKHVKPNQVCKLTCVLMMDSNGLANREKTFAMEQKTCAKKEIGECPYEIEVKGE